MEENNISNNEKIFKISTYFCLALSLVATVTNMIYTILTTSNINDDIFKIIISIMLALVSVILIFVGLYIDKKKVKIFIIIGSLLLSLYSIITIVLGITTPQDKVLDFTGFDIKDVVTWAEERNILIEQVFENSDTIEKYKVIKQDIKEGILVKQIRENGLSEVQPNAHIYTYTYLPSNLTPECRSSKQYTSQEVSPWPNHRCLIGGLTLTEAHEPKQEDHPGRSIGA